MSFKMAELDRVPGHRMEDGGARRHIEKHPMPIQRKECAKIQKSFEAIAEHLFYHS